MIKEIKSINSQTTNYKQEKPLPLIYKNNRKEIVKFLTRNLTCPYPTLIDHQRLNLLDYQFYKLWVKICQEFSIDSEFYFIEFYKSEASFQYSESDLETELYPTIIRTKRWIHLAEKLFGQLVRPFDCKLVTEGKYAKHYTLKEKSENELIEETKYGNPSKFFYRPDNSIFKKILNLCLYHFFFEILQEKLMKIGIEYGEFIGVDDGEPTKYLLMEINNSSGEAHCRPIKVNTFKSSRFDISDESTKKWIKVRQYFDDVELSSHDEFQFGLRILASEGVDNAYKDILDQEYINERLMRELTIL